MEISNDTSDLCVSGVKTLPLRSSPFVLDKITLDKPHHAERPLCRKEFHFASVYRNGAARRLGSIQKRRSRSALNIIRAACVA